jgi:hypothetical protein
MSDVVLSAEGVHKSYNGLEVLRGVSMEVGRGEVKVIIGPSGSGKSTLLRCLALLEPVDSGSVFLEGDRLTDRREKDLAAHRSEVGMVFQRFNLFQNMTALGNVMCGLVEVRGLRKREARERAREFLERVGLADKADNYPEELSGGPGGAGRDGRPGAGRDDDGRRESRAALRASRGELDPDDGRGPGDRRSPARPFLLISKPRANEAVSRASRVTVPISAQSEHVGVTLSSVA